MGPNEKRALREEAEALMKESERLKSNTERSKREIDALREQNALDYLARLLDTKEKSWS